MSAVRKSGAPSGDMSLKEARTGQALNVVAGVGGLNAMRMAVGEFRHTAKTPKAELARSKSVRRLAKVPVVGRVARNPKATALGLGGGMLALHSAELTGDAIAARALHRSAQNAKAKETNVVAAKSIYGDGQHGQRITEQVAKAEPTSRFLAEQVSKFNTKQWATAERLYRSANPKVKRRAYQVMAHAERGPAENRKLMAGRSRMSELERGRTPRAARRRGYNDDDYSLAVGKARRFDAEADRQRRLGMYTGLAGGGALVAGDRAAREFRLVRTTGKDGQSIRGVGFKAGRGRRGALLGAAAGSLAALAGASYHRGVSRRNQPWN